MKRVHLVNCPGCGRELRGQSRDGLRARVLRHARNCASLGWGKGEQMVADTDQPLHYPEKAGRLLVDDEHGRTHEMPAFTVEP